MDTYGDIYDVICEYDTVSPCRATFPRDGEQDAFESQLSPASTPTKTTVTRSTPSNLALFRTTISPPTPPATPTPLCQSFKSPGSLGSAGPNGKGADHQLAENAADFCMLAKPPVPSNTGLLPDSSNQSTERPAASAAGAQTAHAQPAGQQPPPPSALPLASHHSSGGQPGPTSPLKALPTRSVPASPAQLGPKLSLSDPPSPGSFTSNANSKPPAADVCLTPPHLNSIRPRSGEKFTTASDPHSSNNNTCNNNTCNTHPATVANACHSMKSQKKSSGGFFRRLFGRDTPAQQTAASNGPPSSPSRLGSKASKHSLLSSPLRARDSKMALRDPADVALATDNSARLPGPSPALFPASADNHAPRPSHASPHGDSGLLRSAPQLPELSHLSGDSAGPTTERSQTPPHSTEHLLLPGVTTPKQQTDTSEGGRQRKLSMTSVMSSPSPAAAPSPMAQPRTRRPSGSSITAAIRDTVRETVSRASTPQRRASNVSLSGTPLASTIPPEHSSSDDPNVQAIYTAARQIFVGQLVADLDLPADEYAAYLGGSNLRQKQILQQFLSFFDWKDKSILVCLRGLCDKLHFKAESQQLHRIIEAFSAAWASSNPHHGFYDENIIYTVAYAVILLNTDLFTPDLGHHMSRNAFVQNTMDTISLHKPKVLPAHSASDGPNVAPPPNLKRTLSNRRGSNDKDSLDLSLLVNYTGACWSADWEQQLETVLRMFYISVSKEPLRLHVTDNAIDASSGSSGQRGAGSSSGQRSSTDQPSTDNASLFSAPINTQFTNGTTFTWGANNSIANATQSNSIFSKLGRIKSNKFNSSRMLPVDRAADGFHRDSLGSVFSLESNMTSFGVSRHAVGFAGLLWNSMIREEETDDAFGDFAEIEKELAKEVELELLGAPWAKEGIILYRPYIDPSTGKKPKKKDWTQVFAVVQRGQLRLYKFGTSSSGSSKNSFGGGGGVAIGAGNWMENANLVDGFNLCHTVAQELPPPKKKSGFSALWSLTLPQKGLLVFQVGTPEIAKEYVYTCNYWSARLSKEPFGEPVTSMEFGWSDELLSKPAPVNNSRSPSGARRGGPGSAGPLPGDTLNIKEWRPTGQTMVVSDLNEEKQLENLNGFVASAETELTLHNAMRSKLLQLYTPNTLNWHKVHTNWERKSQYLLQQLVRYKTYVEYLQQGINDKALKSKDIEEHMATANTNGASRSDGTISDKDNHVDNSDEDCDVTAILETKKDEEDEDDEEKDIFDTSTNVLAV